jgi:hypothetical protein
VLSHVCCLGGPAVLANRQHGTSRIKEQLQAQLLGLQG